MRYDAGNHDDINWRITHDLIGDADIATECVARIWQDEIIHRSGSSRIDARCSASISLSSVSITFVEHASRLPRQPIARLSGRTPQKLEVPPGSCPSWVKRRRRCCPRHVCFTPDKRTLVGGFCSCSQGSCAGAFGDVRYESSFPPNFGHDGPCHEWSKRAITGSQQPFIPRRRWRARGVYLERRGPAPWRS
jgi:hypothetical protein